MTHISEAISNIDFLFEGFTQGSQAELTSIQVESILELFQEFGITEKIELIRHLKAITGISQTVLRDQLIVIKRSRSTFQVLQAGPVSSQRTVVALYPNAPVNTLAQMPGTQLPSGIKPIFINRIIKGLAASNIAEQIEIVFENLDGTWSSLLVKRSVFIDAKKFSATIADVGYQGLYDEEGKSTINRLIPFLVKYEHHNALIQGAISKSETCLTLGYTDTKLSRYIYNGIKGFDIVAPGEQEQVMLEGYKQHGRPQDASKFVQDILALFADYPIPTVMFLTGFAAKILPIIGCDSFMLEVANSTGTGKSLGQYAALAIDGDPKKLKLQWSSSYANIEPLAAFFKNHVFVLEDGQNQLEKSIISDVIYNYFNEQGKGKSYNTGSTRKTRVLQGIILSSAESQSVDLLNRDGITRRLMTVNQAPFGNVETAKAKGKAYEKIVKKYHGIAGPVFINFVMENRQDWDQWKEQYQQLKAVYDQQASAQDIGHMDKERIAFMNGYLSALHFTAMLVEQCFDVIVNTTAVMEGFATAVYGNMVGKSPAIKAITEFVDYVSMNQTKHFTFGNANQEQKGAITKEYIAVFPAALKEFLSKGDYNVTTVLEGWSKMGIIMKAKNGKTTQKTSMQSYIINSGSKDKTVKTDYPYMYRLDTKAIEKELSTSNCEDDPINEATQKGDFASSQGRSMPTFLRNDTGAVIESIS
ncbi:hypothetical protein KCTCHS21_01310 [Cohnella abietis]|uniref:DUF927 domain-containing protein n=2 Tax=Cohnella abietis TaxID=2507935 RepID=A0A3T1CXZ1_9BACL|nr:hypothetical protein KCTCHS21_01310 [Cohnella abietis]